jgi:hypothetical protein
MLKEEATPKTGKKAYQTPALRVYGDIVSITETVGPNGLMDGGLLGGHMMTH